MGGMKARAIIQMLALFLAGCAGGGNGSYPSLAKRPIESIGSGPATVPVAPVIAEDPALAREINGLLEKARAGAGAFDANLGVARSRVEAAASSAVSSEAWVTAQLAISTLESDRYDSVSALASLDTLYVNRRNSIAGGDAQGGVEAIDQARADVLAIVDRQNDILDGLKGQLRTP